MAPGADGAGAGAAQRMRDRAKRMRDHSVPLKAFAEEIRKLTDDAFQKSQEIDGPAFDGLKPSTIEARLRRSKAANKRLKKGGFTKKAAELRARLQAPGGMKILQITGVMRNSQRATLVGKNKLRWAAVGRLLPHMTGSNDIFGHLPKRNPTVFDVDSNGDPKLKPSVFKKLAERINRWVMEGKTS